MSLGSCWRRARCGKQTPYPQSTGKHRYISRQSPGGSRRYEVPCPAEYGRTAGTSPVGKAYPK